VQDTPTRSAGVSPPGLPSGCGFDHCAPFHRAASPLPTASHARAVVQETAFSWPPIPPGVAWIFQAEPFHSSARVTKLIPFDA